MSNVPLAGPLGRFCMGYHAQRPTSWTVRTPEGLYGVAAVEKDARGHENPTSGVPVHRGAGIRARKADSGCPVHRVAGFCARRADSGCPVHRGADIRARGYFWRSRGSKLFQHFQRDSGQIDGGFGRGVGGVIADPEFVSNHQESGIAGVAVGGQHGNLLEMAVRAAFQ